MILVYLLAAVAALIVYALTSRFGITVRIVIALLVFAIPSISVTVWVSIVGDNASPEAITVYPSGKKSIPSEK